MCDCDICSIDSKINAINRRLTVYKIALTGFSVFIPPYKHQVPIITSYLVYNNTYGNVVDIAFRIFPDQSVQIDSNIVLDNHTLLLS